MELKIHQAKTYDEVEVGEEWQSAGRTVSEHDVLNFAELTGDFNPLHVDREFATNTPYGQPIAHGLLGLAWVAGLQSGCPSMQTVAFTGVADWKFLQPVFFGDTVHVVTRILDKKPKGRQYGTILWEHKLVNQHGVTVQQGTFETMVKATVRKKADLPAAKAA